jgi:hypothetical protein
MMFAKIMNVSRAKGDPKVVRTGPSSITASDRIARNLGWFSLALGALEILAPTRITHALGMEGEEWLVRAYGFREIAAGVLSLSTDKKVGLWSRVAGDGLDMATLVGGLHYDNPKKDNVAVALLIVGGITLLDMATAQEVTARHARHTGRRRMYYERSGFPNGLTASKGVAVRNTAVPQLRG